MKTDSGYIKKKINYCNEGIIRRLEKSQKASESRSKKHSHGYATRTV